MTAPVLSDVAIEDKLNAVRARKAQIEAARATREEAAKLPPSPEEQLRIEEEALARMEREEADEKAWADARARYGKGKVGKVPTPAGVIILRARSLAEYDSDSARIRAGRNDAESLGFARAALIDKVVYPSADAARAILADAPGLWVPLYDLRDALDRGEAEDVEGKA